MLTARDVVVRYGARKAVDGVSFELREGQWMMLVGPNGAGKSTLLRAISRGVPYEGRIALDGRDIQGLKSAELARRVGVLAQQHHVGYAYTVEQIVSLGRYAHRAGMLGRDPEGAAQVTRALRLTGMEEMRHANALTLSGGELQRTFLAQVFAQDPQILLLDEPANHLDLVYQQQVFSLITQWLKQPGRAALCVVHDLSLARRYGTHAMLMGGGKCVAQGEIRQVFAPERLNKVYGMNVGAWMKELLEQWGGGTAG